MSRWSAASTRRCSPPSSDSSCSTTTSRRRTIASRSATTRTCSPSASYLLIAAAVSVVVDLASRRTREAARASADAEVLSTLAGQRSARRVGPERRCSNGCARRTASTSVTLLERDPSAGLTPTTQRDPHAWRIVATVGGEPCFTPDEGEADISIGDELSLVLRGRTLPSRATGAFSRRSPLRPRSRFASGGWPRRPSEVRPLAEADRMRTALLNAVSHDLRIAAGVGQGRRRGPVQLRRDLDSRRASRAARHGDESLDRLDRLVANLLDMSRLQAGALGVSRQPVAVEEVDPAWRSTTSRSRADGSRSRSPTTSRTCSPTPRCSSGSWSI